MKTKIMFALVVVAAAGGIYYALSRKPPEKDDGPKVPPPGQLTVSILNTYTHDTLSYIEGMEFYKGELYESAGEIKQSFVAKYDYKKNTGIPLKKEKLPDNIFGEGMTILNNKLYMLTWKNATMFVFDPVTLKQTGSFPWPHGEGWGMTNDGKSLIANTGGSNIFFLDPNDLKVQRTISVTDDYGPVSNINEMEFVNGVIYANVFTTDQILKIDPVSGRVLARADLSNLYPEFNHFADKALRGGKVMNGIAYNPDTKTFLITGKNWPKMFEVKMD
jgi:glutaminyl-peptide cyclotransferase